MSEGKLTKLKIEAFKDAKFSDPVAKPNDVFTTTVNPEKYTQHLKTKKNNDQAAGTSTNAPKFNKKEPEELELEFLFDRTGVIKDFPATEEGVAPDIEQLKNVVAKYSGEEHKPNYLIISWGNLRFKGAMTEMSIEYKLFKPNGAPIRAVAKVKFIEFMEADLRVAKENNQSPDLTHYREVKEGDTLPLMTFRIYGDSKYYREVARINKLPNFRKLTPGQRIWFPPLQKQS